MRKKNVILENEAYTNQVVVKVLLCFIGFCVLPIILSYTPVFKTNQAIIWRDFGISAIVFFIPYFVYNILHQRGRWFKYVPIFSIIATVFILYSDFEIGRFVFVLWFFPVLIASLYFNRTLSIVTSIATMASINIIDFMNGATIFTPIIFVNGRNQVAIEDPEILYETILLDVTLAVVFITFITLANRTKKLLSDLEGAEKERALLQRITTIMKKATRISLELMESAKSLSEISHTSKELNEQNHESSLSLTTKIESSLEQINYANPLYISMANNIREIAAHLQEVTAMTEHLTSLTDAGSNAITEVITEITTISEASKRSKATMDQLQVLSREIEMIIQTITGISRQTNLLALNASIEASRAGEEGRGFNVVASSIRNLATQSANSAENIKNLVTSIQEEITTAVQTIENESQLIDRGMEIITLAGNSFAEISETQKQLAGSIQSISGAIEEIAAGSEQVTTTATAIKENAGD